MNHLFWVLVLAFWSTTEGLSLDGTKCGQFRCDLHQFCNEDDQRCTPCSTICIPQNHDYDSAHCMKNCQDYIHDLRYLRRDDETQSLRATVEKLQFQVSVITILSSLVLVLLLAFLGVTCCRHGKTQFKKSWDFVKKRILHRKSSVDKYPHDLTHQNPHTESPKPPRKRVEPKPKVTATPEQSNDVVIANPRRNDLVLEMNANQPLNVQGLQPSARYSAQTSSPETDTTTVTTGSRLPAEDSTLDYSYDNVGMNLTPSPDMTPRADGLSQLNSGVARPNRF